MLRRVKPKCADTYEKVHIGMNSASKECVVFAVLYFTSRPVMSAHDEAELQPIVQMVADT